MSTAHHHHHTADEQHSHQGHNPHVYRKQLLLAIALTLPTLYFSSSLQEILHFAALNFPLSNYVPAVSGTLLFFTSGKLFLAGGWQEVNQRKPGMMALIAMALLVSFSYSLILTIAELFGQPIGKMDFWWELATLITIMLLGHWLELNAVQKANDALGSLTSLLPPVAKVLRNRKYEVLDVAEITLEDQISVSPGEIIPVDAVVVSGKAKVDESLLTGESTLVQKVQGSTVFAGTTISLDGSTRAGALVLRATATGDTTAFSQIVRMVQLAQEAKSKTQRLADRAAGLLFYVALVAAAITAIFWSSVGTVSLSFVLERVVTVLIIACPHALGLAIPLVTAITTARAASSGLVIRDRQMFEKAAKLNAVLFDKTGTLTHGKRAVAEFRLAAKAKQTGLDKVVSLAAAVEAQSEHSLGQAIVRYAQDQKLTILRAKDFEGLAGLGSSAKVGKARVLVGSPALLIQNHIRMEVVDVLWADQNTSLGNTVVCVVVDDNLEALIAIGDTVRDTSAQAIYDLQLERIHVGLLTGDAQGVADHIASTLQITEVYAEVLPWHKAEVISILQASGANVGFVGDGINDAPALNQADVSFAIGAGTNIAIESAGIVLIGNDPVGVARAIRLSKRVRIKSLQNLWWAAGYNILAIPLAAGLFMPLGLVLTPALGALLMSVSTLLVAVNAQTLRK